MILIMNLIINRKIGILFILRFNNCQRMLHGLHANGHQTGISFLCRVKILKKWEMSTICTLLLRYYRVILPYYTCFYLVKKKITLVEPFLQAPNNPV
eukprot:snap_masked-scaffold_18-processed-gene-1.24-mRNA-1 protein AED:1.00 eAED:1.00 QI:0/0/0/0/1/1/2/0/96